MRSKIPLVIVFVLGFLMALQEFVPLDFAQNFKAFAEDWTILIGVFAMALGIWSLVRVSVDRVQRRAEGWPFAIVTLLGLACMVVFSIWGWVAGGIENALSGYMFVHFFDHVVMPIQATMYSLLAFFIASAAYRAFRARSIPASLLLVAAVIVMLRVVYMGAVSPPINRFADWIINVPNLAAKRAILVGVGLGMTATALKVILGIERTYLGRE